VQPVKSCISVLKCVTDLSLLRHGQHSLQSSAENKTEDLPLGLKYPNVLHLRISATTEPCYNEIGLGVTLPIASHILWYQLIPHC